MACRIWHAFCGNKFGKNFTEMKKIYIIMCSVLALALTACNQNEEVNALTGNYTYKASGVVRVSDVGDIHLAPETGTMSVTGTEKEDEVIMSFNHSSGDAYEMRATVTKDSLYVRPMHRYLDVEVSRDTTMLGTVIKNNETFDIEVTGSGKMLSDGNISFSLTYSGKALNEAGCTLNGNNIMLQCKRNAK